MDIYDIGSVSPAQRQAFMQKKPTHSGKLIVHYDASKKRKASKMDIDLNFDPSRKGMKRRRVEAQKRRKKRKTIYQQAEAQGNIRTGGFIGMEKKFHDFEKATTTVVATVAGSEQDPATVNCLNGIAQGDGESQRDGRNYVIDSLYIKGEVNTVAQEATTANRANLKPFEEVSVALVLDTQTNGAQAAAENVFVDPSNTELDCKLLRNLQYNTRFRVLWEENLHLDFNTLAHDGTQYYTLGTSRGFKIWLPNLKIPVTTTGTSANVSVISNNSLHMIAVSRAGLARIEYHGRLRFRG